MNDDATITAERNGGGGQIEDAELLRRYTAEKAEDAFAELVRRHVNFVYGCALRRLGGDVQFAEDVTQQVFVALARKAPALTRHPVLSGWLFQATRHAAAHLRRTEQRRHTHEMEAHTMNEITSSATNDAEWNRLRPVLDDALDRLNEMDRQAVLLRFFEGKSFAEIGARLELAENTARMRVDRAVDRLRSALAQHGVTSTTAALGLALSQQAAIAAPAGLALSVTGAALAGAGAGGAAGAATGGGLIATFMSMTKLQVGITSALAVAGATGFVLQAESNATLRDEVASLRRENAAIVTLRTQNLQLARSAAEMADMRNDDAALKRLSDEAAGLKTQLEQAARKRAQALMTEVAIYDQSALDQRPAPKLQAPPQYPFELRRAGIQGEVVVDFIVDPSGSVRNAFAIRSGIRGQKVEDRAEIPGATGARDVVVLTPSKAVAEDNSGTAGLTEVDANAKSNGLAPGEARRLFEAAAIEAVSKWKFSAGRNAGREVPTHMQTPIVFTLNEE